MNGSVFVLSPDIMKEISRVVFSSNIRELLCFVFLSRSNSVSVEGAECRVHFVR